MLIARSRACDNRAVDPIAVPDHIARSLIPRERLGQILHVRYPDPNDPFVGIGVPQTIPTWIDNDNYAME